MVTKFSKKKSKKIGPITEKQSRVEVYRAIAEETGLKRVQVESVFQALGNLIQGHLNSDGSGEISIPGLVKIRRIMRKRTQPREMLSPLTGTVVQISSKPARTDVKLIPLKSLRDMLDIKTF